MTAHNPFEREYPGSDTLVLFVHGFMGSPSQFLPLAETVFESGCSSAAILLPGHGGSGVDFSRFGERDWQEYVCGAVGAYSERYANILLAGHSMGGLLCLRASLTREKTVKGVFLMSSPLKLNFVLRPVINALRLRFGRNEREKRLWETYNAYNSVARAPFYVCPLWLRPVYELMKLMRRAKRILKDVKVPVTVINSKSDETVSFKSMEMFRKGLSGTETEFLVLRHSLHACYTPEESASLSDRLAKSLKRISGLPAIETAAFSDIIKK